MSEVEPGGRHHSAKRLDETSDWYGGPMCGLTPERFVYSVTGGQNAQRHLDRDCHKIAERDDAELTVNRLREFPPDHRRPCPDCFPRVPKLDWRLTTREFRVGPGRAGRDADLETRASRAPAARDRDGPSVEEVPCLAAGCNAEVKDPYCEDCRP